MNRFPWRRWTRSLPLALAAGGAAAQGQPAPPQNVVSLAAAASVVMPQDWLTLVLSTTRDGAEPGVVQSQLKQALDAALAEARRAARSAAPQALELQTGDFSLHPRYGRDGRMNGWTGRAELIVQGRDTAAIAQLAGRIQTLTVSSTGFSLSREAREKVEAQVVADAIARFRTRADEVSRQFGFASWTLREVNVQTELPMAQPQPRIRAMLVASAAADESLPVEAGKTTVSATVAGSIALAR